MKRVACTMLLAALSYAPALAIPGQTDPQVLAWGKGNSAFTNFVYRNNPDGPGHEYMAKLKIDGHDIEFHAKPNGAIKMESFVFLDLLASPPPVQNVDLVRETIARAYGPQYASDFASAQRLPIKGNEALWRGKLLGYALMEGAFLLVFTPHDFDAWSAQIH